MDTTSSREEGAPAANSSSPASRDNHRHALRRYLRDPHGRPEVVEPAAGASGSIVVVRDAYPKARHHFLLLFQASLHSPSTFPWCVDQVAHVHLPLLREAAEVVELVRQRHLPPDTPAAGLLVGFHALPSMQDLHLHLLTPDLLGQGMRKKQHYNSFITPFFIPLARVLAELEAGRGIAMPREEMERLLRLPLQCCHCQAPLSNMPALRLHLAECGRM